MMARWSMIDGQVSVPAIDLVWVFSAAVSIVVLLAFVIARQRVRKHIQRIDRRYRSLSELKQEFSVQAEDFDAWVAKARRMRSEAVQQLDQLYDEACELDEKAAIKRPVYDELNRRIEAKQAEFQQLQSRHEDIVVALQSRDELSEQVITLNSQIHQINDDKAQAERQLDKARLILDLYVRQTDLAGYAHYEQPDYLYQSSERFKVEIKRERAAQQQMIHEQTAITGLEAIGEKSERIAWARRAKLLLRAFNLECDKLFASIRYSNRVRTIEEVDQLAQTLEKLLDDRRFALSAEYVESKLRECTLVFQEKIKAKEEADEARIQREELRQERKAQREYEIALKKAKDEERAYQDMLKKARMELNGASKEQAQEQQERIDYLEQRLEQARKSEQRTLSLAQQVRCGFVYVISNEGSFGKGVYKIGLTRRLDPMDRVKELSDASVPFSYDVHGIIYSEDAEKLESDLHKQFDARRVNVVNSQKEFFRVDLGQIETAINERVGEPVSLKRDGFEGDDYLEATRLRKGLIGAQGSLAIEL